jgi:YfiR/HmsC-like
MRCACVGVVCAVVLLGGVCGAGQRLTSAEVKAAFLFNFAKFVEWPAGDVPSPLFVIGILGSDAIAESLSDIVKGKALAGGRQLAVRRLNPKDDPAEVHILFISASESAQVPDLMKRLDKASVLTVSDMPRFLASGGVIQLRTEDDRIRFDVDLQHAHDSRLVINSKLLALAGTVNPAKTH